MEKAFEQRPRLLPLTLALLTVIFLKPVIFPPGPGQVLTGQDFRDMFYPLQEYISQLVHSGQFPLWNPHTFIGHPIIGNPHAALFYPATWIMWLVGVQRGMNLMLVIHTWFGAWGMARLTRSFRASYVGSLLAGVIYAMSGWASARYYAGHYNLLIVFAWVPWAMLAYRRVLLQPSRGALIAAIAVIGLVLLAGHPPLTVYLGLAVISIGVYYVFRSEDYGKAIRIAIWRLAIIGIGGVILGAALIVPAAELTLRSVRTTTSEAFSNSYALSPAQYLLLAFPNLFGNPKNPITGYWGADNYEEYLAYAGLIPLLAIPLALRWRRSSDREMNPGWEDNPYWLGMIGLGLVLSIGLQGGLMPLLWRWIPGLTSFRVPARALLFTVIGLAGLTAQLVTVLQTSSLEERREGLQPALYRWLPAAIIAGFIGSLYFSGQFATSTGASTVAARAELIGGDLAAAGVILLGIWVMLWLWTHPQPEVTRWALILTCGVIILDAWHVGFPIIEVGKLKTPTLWQDVDAFIPAGADSRVAQSLTVNLASTSHVLNIYGYDPLPVGAYQDIIDAANLNDNYGRVDTLLGVRYLMDTQSHSSDHDLQLLGKQDENYYYLRLNASARAWLASQIIVQPDDTLVQKDIVSGMDNLEQVVYVDQDVNCATAGANASITQYTQDHVEIQTSGAGGLLVLTDQYYPGWQAEIDGQTTPIYRADTIFRAVCVPSGNHTIGFTYRPRSLYIGIVISAVGWIGLLMIWFGSGIWNFARRRRRPASTPPALEAPEADSTTT